MDHNDWRCGFRCARGLHHALLQSLAWVLLLLQLLLAPILQQQQQQQQQQLLLLLLPGP